MNPVTPEYARLRDAITERLNAYDLANVVAQRAPKTEYDPEMEDFAALITAGAAITPGAVAAVWHKWCGDPANEPAEPTQGMADLAADLHTIQQDFVQY